MAADDRKGRSKFDILDSDEDGWTEAIEEWDKALDFFQEGVATQKKKKGAERPEAAKAARVKPAQPKPQPQQEAHKDALVEFIVGDMDLPDDGQEALGSLLGSTPVVIEVPTPVKQAVPAAGEPADIGISPQAVASSDVEVEVGQRARRKPWEQVTTPLVQARDTQPVHEEPTPVRSRAVAAAQAEMEKTEAPLAPGKGEEGFDLGALLEKVKPTSPAAPAPRGRPKRISAPLEQVAPPVPVKRKEPSLDLFDELVAPPEEPHEEEIVAGEVLPQPPAVEPPPSELPLEVAVEELEEPEIPPPAIPADLGGVDLTMFQPPTRGQPLTPSHSYWEELSERLQLEANLTDSSSRAAALELMVAGAFEEVAEIDDAINHYREVLNHRAGHVPALRALRRLHAQRREADQVAELLGEMAERVGPDERRALLATRAELLWSRTGDDAGARLLLDDIAPRATSDLRGLLVRADLAAAAQDDEELLSVIGPLADVMGDQTAAAALHLELGRAREILGQAEHAAAAYRRAVAVDPTCVAAQEGLIRIAAGHEDAAGLCAGLAASGVHEGAWGARRRRRCATLALHHQLPNTNPLDDLAQAAAAAPDDPLVLEELAEVRRAGGDGAGAVDAFRALARAEADPARSGQALVEAALLAEDALHDTSVALDLYGEARALLPDYAPIALGAAQIMANDAGAERRLEARRSAAAASKGSNRAALHLQAAIICQEELHRDEDATGELLACAEHDPSCRLALPRLEQIYRGTGSLDRLAAVIDTAAEAADDPADTNDLLERAALLYEGPLAKPDVALRRYRQILQTAPDQPHARWGVIRNLARLGYRDDLAEELSLEATSSTNATRAARVWTRCGNLLWAAGRQGEAEASYRMAVGKVAEWLPAGWALVACAAGAGRWSEVADRWTAMLGALDETSAQRKALLCRLAVLQEQVLDDPAEALRTYEMMGNAPGASLGVLRLLARTGREEQLAQELERSAATTTDPGERFALLVAAGELASRAGADMDQAAAKIRAALEVSPSPLARQSLERLYETNQAWRPLADLLLSDLNEATTGPARVAIYERLAQLDLRRADESNARLSFESILELDPAHLGALRFLQRYHLAAEHYPILIGVLRREAEAAQAYREDAASLWLEMARLLSHRPLEGADASSATISPGLAALAIGLTSRGALQQALERQPTSLLLLRALLDLACLEGEPAAQAELFTKLAQAMGAGRDAAIYLCRAGELLGESDFASYKASLQNLPDFLGAIYRLRDGGLRARDWASACLAAEAEGAASRVLELVVPAYLLAGEVAHQQLGDQPRAVRAYRAALEADPADRLAFERLREHLEHAGKWDELAALLHGRTEVERSRAKLVALHRSLAAIARDKLQDREQAKRELRLLLALHPDDLETLSILADLSGEDGEWPEAADALIRMARLEKNTAALRDLFLRLGVIYHDKTPDPKRAIAALNKVITLDSSHLDALSRLSDLYLKAWDYKRALATTQQLYEKDPSTERKVDHLLRIAKIHEDGLKDSHQASISYRQALDQAPSDLRAIGELCGFFARQGDQRSLMVHLDRSVATMRARLKHDPFETFAYQALFKIFGWRKAPDGCLTTAEILATLGQASPEEQEFIETHRGAVGSPGSALSDPEHDEWLFVRNIPGGFRQVFQLLADPFTKLFPGDIKAHGASRTDRIASINHPVRRVGDALARELGVAAYELYVLSSNPTLLIVENTPVPAVLMGKALLEDATEDEILFHMGRCLWMIRKAMVLPSRLRPEDLEVLVAGVVRQYAPDFQPVDADPKAVQQATREVGRAIPRKLRQELMPFALECSGSSVDLRGLGASVVHSANRAGLLACRSIHAATSALRKIAGQLRAPQSPAERVKLLRGNEEVEELLRFAVSDSHFELRRAMHIGIR